MKVEEERGVMKEIKDGESWGGINERNIKKWLRDIEKIRRIGK